MLRAPLKKFSFAGFILFAFAASLSVFAADLKVYYISVGQGDAQYLELPDGKNMLIDGGPININSASNPLIKFLSDKGVVTINHVFLSHPHSDHYYGLSALYDRTTIKKEKYYDSFLGGSTSSNAFREKAKAATAVRYYDTYAEIPSGATFYSNTTISPPLHVVMLHNGEAFATNAKSANDYSLVLKVIYGSSTFVFGGDTGAGGSYQPLEGWLASRHGTFLRSDCYKVHHHGSSSSSYDAFLAALVPKFAFIGVGLGNSYGHPTAAALDRIKNILAQTNPSDTRGGHYGRGIFATDYDGTIEVVTSGDGTYTINGDYVPTSTSTGTVPGGTVPGGAGDVVGYVLAYDNLFYPDRGENLRLAYYLNKSGDCVFRVYTLSGDIVIEEKRPSQPAANPYLYWTWNGKNADGQKVAPGAYFVFVKTPDGQSVKKAVVMR